VDWPLPRNETARLKRKRICRGTQVGDHVIFATSFVKYFSSPTLADVPNILFPLMLSFFEFPQPLRASYKLHGQEKSDGCDSVMLSHLDVSWHGETIYLQPIVTPCSISKNLIVRAQERNLPCKQKILCFRNRQVQLTPSRKWFLS
jgi:hypothetical protein